MEGISLEPAPARFLFRSSGRIPITKARERARVRARSRDARVLRQIAGKEPDARNPGAGPGAGAFTDVGRPASYSSGSPYASRITSIGWTGSWPSSSMTFSPESLQSETSRFASERAIGLQSFWAYLRDIA